MEEVVTVKNKEQEDPDDYKGDDEDEQTDDEDEVDNAENMEDCEKIDMVNVVVSTHPVPNRMPAREYDRHITESPRPTSVLKRGPAPGLVQELKKRPNVVAATQPQQQQNTAAATQQQQQHKGITFPNEWQRPKAAAFQSEIVFMHTDTTYSSMRGERAIIELHGVTAEGNSVLVNVYNFMPYFYVIVDKKVNIDGMVACLEEKLARDMQRNKFFSGRNKYVEGWKEVTMKSILGFKRDDPKDLHVLKSDPQNMALQILMSDPKLVPNARKYFHDGRLGYMYGKIPTYEANVRFDIRFMVDTGIHGCQWVKVEHFTHTRSRRSTAQIELDLVLNSNSNNNSNNNNNNDNNNNNNNNGVSAITPLTTPEIAPFRTLSYDIECATCDGSSRFPDAKMDWVIAIGCYGHTFGRKEPDLRCVFALVPKPGDTVGDMGNIVCYVFHDEIDLLFAFRDFVRVYDPDIVTGYNMCNFDNKYLQERADALGIGKEFSELSRLKNRKCVPRVNKKSSRAMGYREDYVMNAPGRSHFDLLEYMQRNEKFKSYSLNFVSATILKDTKEDVPFWRIRPLYMSGPEGRATVNKYCLKDCKLPWDIIERKLIFVNNIAMARVVGVPFKWLLERGQQAKTQSKLLRCTRANGYLLPTVSPPKRPYQGAIVVNPDKGYYTIPIVVLDFSSLYPSIMIAHNLCYCTFFLLKFAAQLGLKREDYFVPPLDFGKREPFGFVKPHIRQGILPMILMDLLRNRGIAKNGIKAALDAGNNSLAKIMDGLQLAFKITANSVYGFTSANMLPLTEIAESVTSYGRDMITTASRVIHNHYRATTIDTLSCLKSGIDPNILHCIGTGPPVEGSYGVEQIKPMIKYYEKDAHVVYGDSVIGRTPILVRRKHGLLSYVNIEDLPHTEWEKYNGDKEISFPKENTEIWSDKGFTPIIKIIRHYTYKDIHRVSTRGGSVCVTSDHSLLRPNGDEVRPIDVKINDELMHAELPKVETFLSVPLVRKCAYAMGLFFLAGQCTPEDTFEIEHKSMDRLERALEDLDLFYPHHLTPEMVSNNNKTFRLVVHTHTIVKEWKDLFYNPHNQKIIPDCIINASEEDVRDFTLGYCGTTNLPPHFAFKRDDNDTGAAGLVFLMTRLRYSVTISLEYIKCDFNNDVLLFKTQTVVTDNANLGRYIDYVYDLETENHHFAAGVGKMVVHNTDSVMVDFGDITVERALALGKEASAYLKRYFTQPNDMLFEKVYFPYLLGGKKRYAALFWTRPDKHDKMDVKGFESARRDWSGICTKVQEEALKKLLYNRDLGGAVSVVHEACRALLTNRVDTYDVTLTKGFTQPMEKYEKNKSLPPHICVVKKRMERDPATAPRVGERVTYVMVQGTEERTGERAEDPLFAMQHNIPIDGSWYIENQLVKPCIRLFQAALCQDPVELADLSKTYKKKPHLTAAYKILFQGPHMQTKKQLVRTIGGMAAFVTRTASCVVCKRQCINGSATCNSPICMQSARSTVINRVKVSFLHANARLEHAKRTCVTCQKGTPYDDIVCENKTCPNWYHRYKMQLEFTDQQTLISRFDF